LVEHRASIRKVAKAWLGSHAVARRSVYGIYQSPVVVAYPDERLQSAPFWVGVIWQTLSIMVQMWERIKFSWKSLISSLVVVDRLGSSEVEQVQRVVDGVELLIQMEKKLEAKQSVTSLIPAQKSNIKVVKSCWPFFCFPFWIHVYSYICAHPV